MQKKLKIGFIGGAINSAVGNTHKIASQMDNRWELTAGCFSRNKDINLKTAELWSVNKLYDDWKTFLINEKGNLDAVSILTPTNLHFEMVSKAMEFGYPVICEKTLTTTFEESTKICDVVNNLSRYLVVINNYTGYPMLRELKSMIEQKKLGKIVHLQVEMPQEGFNRFVNGNIPKPQGWRLNDGEIPTIHLDLAVHLHHIVSFLIKEKILEVCANQQTNGFFSNVIDNVQVLVNYSNNISGQIWFSKAALGYRNGLKIRLFGEEGSAEWIQMESEYIKYCNKHGKIEIIDRASPDVTVANQDRYNRFKSGHPAGFIEAFANYYYDIADSISEYKKTGKFNREWLVSADSAKEGMAVLKAMVLSAHNKKWQKVE